MVPEHDGLPAVDQGRACLLITRAPGAGKSTVSAFVARALSRSALIDAHVVSRLVASGYVWPLGEPADEAARQVRLLNADLCALAADFAEAGFTPVIDVVLPDGDQLDTFDGYDELRAAMRHGFGHVGWWFDTSDLSPQQTAQRVIAAGPVRAAVQH